METIFIFLASFLVQPFFPSTPSPDWTYYQPWHLEEGKMTFSATSTSIIDACKKKPDLKLVFPVVIMGLHLLYLDEELIYATGDPQGQWASNLYDEGSLSCHLLSRGHTLRWKVIAQSRLKAFFHEWPSLKAGPIFQHFLAVYMPLLSGGIHIIYALLALLLFSSTMSSKIVQIFSGANLLFALQHFLYCNSLFGFRVTTSSLEKTGALALSSAFILFWSGMFLEKLISKKLFWIFITLLVLGLFFVPLSTTLEQMDTALVLFLFIPIIVSFLIFAITLIHRWSTGILKWQRWEFLVIIIFGLSAFHDISLHCGLIASLPLFPLGTLTLVGLIFLKIYKQMIATIQEKEVLTRQLDDNRAYISIAQSVQMLAHDVMKPFSLIKMGITLLKNASSWEEVTKNVNILEPELTKATHQVKNMLGDILELGSKGEPVVEAICVKKLLRSVIDETLKFHHYPPSVAITYEWHHESFSYIDQYKMTRVIANIFENALQAMSFKGNCRIATKEISDSFMEICIANSGSFIAEEERTKVFELGYTNGKKGGSGFGLAIAQKIVLAHGGRIWCESDKNETRFLFTLPTHKNIDP